jgi:hypothetical protein
MKEEVTVVWVTLFRIVPVGFLVYKMPWGRFISEHLSFSSTTLIPSMLHTHLSPAFVSVCPFEAAIQRDPVLPHCCN